MPLPPEAAGPAGGRLGCPAEQISVAFVHDERTPCATDPAGCLVYRVFHVRGCGREADIRCYESQPGAPMSCITDPLGAR